MPTPVLPTQGGNSPNVPVPAPDPGSDPAPDPVSYAAPDPVPVKRNRTRIIVSRKIKGLCFLNCSNIHGYRL